MHDISARKASHLDLCATDDVAFSDKSTLFEAVHLIHDALADLDIDAIDVSTEVLGKELAAPVVIAAMTGGVQRAEHVNRQLAEVAEAHGLGFGFGSMRPLLEGIALGYQVRDVAPTIPLFGNLGVVQARTATDQQLLDLVGTTGIDALAVHLNPAQEVVQDGGDTDFRGGVETFARLVEMLPVPVFAKETGCGMSHAVALRLQQVGVEWVDVGGAGGTSWVGVETLRARASTERLGRLFWDWGIPTAASVVQVAPTGMGIIATGGVKNGLDIAKALALGASAAGLARPFLQALNAGGPEQVGTFAKELIHELRVAMLLTGAPDVPSLRSLPRHLDPQLQRWVP